VATQAVDFVRTRLWDGRALRRSFKDGLARFNGYLEDYGLIVGALVDIYEASLDRRYLEFARELADVMLERFADRENGGFFFTSDDHESLITRGKAPFDGSTPWQQRHRNGLAQTPFVSGQSALHVRGRKGAPAVCPVYGEAAICLFSYA